ncbi:LysR family transcriptional regulator [Vibrio sp. 99-8-1]|uniref:LysR family transcriptional regulator n=1 Tax=Vibrio sp. 99-8-1 TaxID=2607602 RepID=UPI001493312B|nr:LysR family transcriptional regulator [Vibrio sp. 99-8-1]NOI65235.1 LysR family transcriptional regulator [Vibrio sp. 99-8-1]
MKDFNYNQLISFVEVALYLNISTAAQHLNKSRATISEHIESLEFELGHKLFYRSGRKISLTPFGEKILRPSILLTRQIFTWQNTVEKANPNTDHNCIRLAYDNVMPKKDIKGLMEHFHHQGIDIECVSLSSNISTDLLTKKAVDIIIAPNEDENISAEVRREIEWKIIGSMPYRFYAHRDYFSEKKVELSQLLSKIQILPNEYQNKSSDEKFIFSSNNKIINDLDLLRSALENKMGWAFLPKHILAEQWNDIEEFQCSLGKEGFVTPILARWRPGEEVIISSVLTYFEQNEVSFP